MERRGFLGMMLAGLGGLVLKPDFGLLWQPNETAVEVVAPGAYIGLQQITMEMLRRIVNDLQVRVPHVDCAKIGHTTEGFHTLNHQHYVDMFAPSEIDRYGLDVDRYIAPLAQALSRRSAGLKGCGSLSLPVGVEAACLVKHSSGLALRGVKVYDIGMDSDRLRFDMLVAQ